MNHRHPKILSVAWAWSAGWALASVGMSISDVYSSPNRGLAAFLMLGFAGWAIGAAGTIRYVRLRFGADIPVIVLSVAGWVVGALVAVVLGLLWMETWNLGYLGLPVGAALGGAIGGTLTLPVQSLASRVSLVRQSLRGALIWGASFLVFQVLAFYAGYLLVLMTAVPLASIIGWGWATVPGWALAAGVCGFLAARLASTSLRITKQAAT
jgi:hypothetical protein